MPNPVVHFEIMSKEPARAQEFYRKLFDWHVNTDNPFNYGFVDTHAGGINGGIAGTGNSPRSLVTFYVEVDDLQAYLNKAEALGGKTIMPVTDIPGVVTFALFADFEGNVVGLVKGMGGQQA